ncbi:hypothetical protein B0H11DRAFT_1901183 [Mycena galericulata]|nr:hypothetical protein B0H11DRAFT_1901183 [Mycena galericulata]
MLFGPSATEVVFNGPPILQNLEEFVVEKLDPDGNTLNILPASLRRFQSPGLHRRPVSTIFKATNPTNRSRWAVRGNGVSHFRFPCSNSIGHALGKLEYLRELWLDIGYLDNPGYNAIQPPLSTTTAARRWALDLAIAVSSLDRVAIPHLSGIEVVWLVSGIRRDPAGGPVAVMLVELLKYTESVMVLNRQDTPEQKNPEMWASEIFHKYFSGPLYLVGRLESEWGSIKTGEM